MMLEEIYNYEKKNGNLEKALIYHEKMMEYNANEQLLKHQGQLLEMEQQYNVAARDLQITRLKAQQDKVKYIIAFIALLFLSITGFTVIRLRNNRRKTQRLLSQIEELTQMQIIRLVEAEKKAQEMERKRIGQELHDDLASSLAGVLQYMRTKTSRENDPAETRKQLCKNKVKIT
jgi:signal transduction histidine kinase